MRVADVEYDRTPEQVLEWIRYLGNGKYIEVKYLPDGSIAVLTDLVFTRAICLGVTESCSYTTRFCYRDRDKASLLFETLQSEDDELEGYTARRG